MACCVSGYHVYKDIWAAAVGEVLASRREPSNASDRYDIYSGTKARKYHRSLTAEDLESVLVLKALYAVQ